MAQKLPLLKRSFFTFLTVVFSLVILLTVNEIIFRLVRGAPNPLGATTQMHDDYLFKPNSIRADQTNQFNEYNYTAHINSHGYRGAEFTHPKPEGLKRIMVIGDSFTFGVGAQDEETIPFLIGKHLKKEHPEIEVINAGVGHASPIYHYVNLKNFHLKYEPDLVILMLDLTDIQDDWRHERQAVYDKDGDILFFDHTYLDGKRNWWKWLTFYCASWAQFDRKVLRSFEKRQLIGAAKYREIKEQGMRSKAYIVNMPEGYYPDDVILDFDGLLFLRGKMRERLIRRQFERTAKYLDKIKKLLDKNNIPMILVVYPYGIYVGVEEWNEGRYTWGFEKDTLYTDYLPFEIIGNYARSRGIPFINTTPALIAARQVSEKPFYFNWDGHMTPTANKVLASLVASNSFIQNWLEE